MSVVSGVTLQTGLLDAGRFDADRPWATYGKPTLIDEICAWLGNHGFGYLISVEDAYGGSKRPQVGVYGGGFNSFPEEKFADFVTSLPWESPESLVLLINPEYGPTKIFRPKAVPEA